ncbi:MAG: hypothetical protein R3Y22_02060 [Bacteroidales bacterium]
MNTKVLWINEGEILNSTGFSKVVEGRISAADKEQGTITYWWSRTEDGNRYADLDCYQDAQSAMQHLNGWREHSEEFMKNATIGRCLVLGDVTDDIRGELIALTPQYMSFYGGFSKDKPTNSDTISDIIWSLEGKITNKELFKESMEKLTVITKAESGSICYLWYVDDEDNFFILEHYIDSAAATEHMATSKSVGNIFFDSTQIDRFRTYSNINNKELAESISALNPENLEFIGGFSKA